MRVLIFAPAGYPPQGPEGLVTAKLVQAMLSHGLSLDMITCGNHVRPYPQPKNGLWKSVEEAAVVLTPHGGYSFDEIWHRTRGAFRTGHVCHGLAWVDGAVSVAETLAAKRGGYDLLMSRSNPDYAHLPALVAARRWKLPWICNWSDPLPDHKLPPPYGAGPSSRLGVFEWRFLRAVSREASWHTFTCQRQRKYMAGYLGPKVYEQSTVVPHLGMPPQERIGACVATGSLKLVHLGTMNSARNPLCLLEGLRLFVSSAGAPPRIEVDFVGAPDDLVMTAAKRSGVSEFVRVLPPQDYETTWRTLGSYDVLLVVEAPCDEGIFLPSKFVDYVQTGRPVLAVSPKRGTLADILNSDGGGIAADNRDPRSVAKAIGIMYDAWTHGKLEARWGSAHLQAQFSQAAVLSEYDKVLDMVGCHVRA